MNPKNIPTHAKTQFALAVGLMMALGGIFAARGASLTWDPNVSSGSNLGGTGTWDLNSTANWWNGAADVTWKDNSAAGTNAALFSGSAAGTVTLNTSLSASNLQFTTTGYTLSGAGTLTLGAGGINASSLTSGATTIGNALSLSGGQQPWLVGSGGQLAINGTVTRSVGTTVDASSNGVTSTSLTMNNGIIGGWATTGDTIASTNTGDFLSVSNGILVICTNYVAISSAASSTPNTNTLINQNLVSGILNGANAISHITNSVTINSLITQGDFDVTNNSTLTIGSGGFIFRGPSRWILQNNGGNQGTGNAINSGLASGELFLHSPNTNQVDWRVWPQVKDNGATPTVVVKDGPAVVILQNVNNAYTGGTIINNGVLAPGRALTQLVSTNLGFGSVTVNPNGILEVGYNSGAANSDAYVSNNIVVQGGKVLGNDGHIHMAGSITVSNYGATFGSSYDGSGNATTGNKALFLDGVISGSGPITLQQAADAGEARVNGNEGGASYNSSVVCFSNNANSYSGTITVVPYTTGSGKGSYLAVNSSNALANATISPANNAATAAGQRFTNSLGASVIFGTGFSTYNLGALTGNGGIVLSNWNENTYAPSGTIILSVGTNNASTTYGGSILGNGSFYKIGTGALTLSGASTVGGNIHTKAGTLVITGNVTNNNFSDVGQTGTDNGTMIILSGGTFYNTSDYNLGDIGSSAGTLNMAAGAYLRVNQMFLGSANGSGSTASGTVNQTNGNVLLASGADGAFVLGGRSSATTGGVGTYNLMGGNFGFAAGGNTWCGGYGSGTMNQSGGTFNCGSWLSIGRWSGDTGVWNLTNGTLNQTNTATRIIMGEGGTGTLNVTNTGQVITTGGVRVGIAGTGTLNLGGGTVTTPLVETTGGTSTFNFNGGTLQASASSTTFMTGLTHAYVLNGGAVIDCQANNITIAQALLNNGSGGLTKLGSGTLKLAGANTYAGATTVNIGTLQNGAANTVPSGSVVINNATWDLNTFSDTVGGLTGSGTVDTVAGGSPTLTVNNSANNTFSGVIKNTAGTLALTKSGSGTLTLTGASTYSGNTTINAGTLVLGPSGSIANSAHIFANGIFDVSQLPGFNLNGAVGQTLCGSGVVTGIVNVASAALISPGNGLNSAGTLTLTNDLNITGGTTNVFDLSNVTTVGGGVNDLIVVGGNLTASGMNTILVNPTGASLANGTYSLIKYGVAHGSSLAGNFTLAFVTAPPRVNASIVDNLASQEIDLVVSANPAALVWQGTNTSTWDATITTNWLNGSVSDAFFTGDNVVFDNTSTNPIVNLTGILVPGSVTVNGSSNYVFTSSGNLSGVTGLIDNNTGTLTVLTTNTYSGGTTIASGTVQVGNGTASGAIGSGNITNNGSLIYNHPDIITLAQVVSGSGSLTQQGSGTLTLNGANTFNGGTTIASGTVAITNDTALGASGSGLTFNGGTLQTANTNTLNNRNVTLNSGGGTINTPTSSSLQISNVITGTGVLTTAGAGTLTVSGANNYSGGTTISAGALQVGTGGTVGTGPVTNYATLQFNRADNYVFANPVIGTNGAGLFLMTPASTGTLELQSTNLYLATGGGVAQVNGGTFQIDPTGLLVSGGEFWVGQNATTGACIINGGTLIVSNWIAVGRNNNAAVGSLTLNSGSVQKYGGGNIILGSLGGNGTLTVNGGSIYDNTSLLLSESSGGQGYVNLNGGTIQANAVANYGGATSIMRFNGGTLSATTNNSLFLSGLSQALVQNGGAIIDDGGYTISVNQPLLGDPTSPGGGLTKLDTGTMVLSGYSSTYTGGTVVSNGVLQLNQDAVLHYTFNQAGITSGTIITNLGTGGAAYNGTVIGFGVTNGVGRYGNALSINGVGGGTFTNIVVVSNNVVNNINGAGGNWTVGVWINTGTAGAEYLFNGAVGYGWNSGETVFYLTSASSITGTKAGLVRWGGGFDEGTATPLNNNAWHFVVITDTGGNVTNYVDGVADTWTVNGISATGTGGMWVIGGSPDTGDGTAHFNGLIDEVYMFNRGLSPSEIQTLYSANNNLNPVLPTNTPVTLAKSTSVLNLNDVSQTIGSLTGVAGSSVLIGQSDVLTLGNDNTTTAFSGVISGAGGLTKIGSGTLTLTGANTYSANTYINAGALALSGAGSISNSPNIVLGGGATLDVSGETSTFTLSSTQTLAATAAGTVIGNANLGGGSLVLNYTNGTPTLLATNGTFTLNNNSVTVTVLGTALPAGSYKLIATNSGGTVSGSVSSSTVLVNGAGYSAGATTTLTIVNGELYLVVNHPPVANGNTYTRNGQTTWRIPVSNLLTNATDPDNDALTLVGVGVSTNGILLVVSGGYVQYYNPNLVDDQFSYTVTDGNGGTSSANITLTAGSVVGVAGQISSFAANGGTASMTFAGIPGYLYQVQVSTNMSSWNTLWTTNAPAGGVFEFVDPSAPQPDAFYRLMWNGN